MDNDTTPRAPRVRCQSCKRRNAVYRTGSDGFSSRPGSKVCDNWVCRTWASGGYPVTFHALVTPKAKS